ncbi:hypothetical protein GOODEAATRI_018450, partial [Goodea atripinnis]
VCNSRCQAFHISSIGVSLPSGTGTDQHQRLRHSPYSLSSSPGFPAMLLRFFSALQWSTAEVFCAS